MKHTSILKEPNQVPSTRSISFHPQEISDVRYFDLTSIHPDGSIYLTTLEERQQRRPVINGPASDPENALERQPNFIAHETNKISSIINDIDSHPLRICNSILRGIIDIELSDIFSLMSLKEESICIPKNNTLPSLEDRVKWRKNQSLVHQD